jgi:hypothetical protein
MNDRPNRIANRSTRRTMTMTAMVLAAIAREGLIT